MGVRVIQLHTGGRCHLDADMTRQGLEVLGTEGMDLIIVENIGNLLCPAEVDTGAVKNAMILSVPEGDDKPLKYPLMFSVVDVLLINKIDAMEFFNFDMEATRERVKRLNPDVKIIPISAKTGEGIAEWAEWIRDEVKTWNCR
jgi:hydrogenase nickel incorporation protein HypB